MADVFEAMDHSVKCRRCRKGARTNVAYEDICIALVGPLTQELIEKSLSGNMSDGPNARFGTVELLGERDNKANRIS